MAIGKIVMEIAPSKENPRNSEGAFLTLEDGRIIFMYSRFLGETDNDDAKAYIALRESHDGGWTWSDDKIVFSPDDFNAVNIMSVSLVHLPGGDVGLFFVLRYGWHDTRAHLFRSKDLCKTWESPVCCVYGPGYYVLNNDRVTVLKNGRIILPTAYHRMRGNDTRKWNSFDGRGIPVIFYSDDDGYTWKESDNYAYISVPGSKSGLQEPGVIELYENCLWQWTRTDCGCQYQCFSYDNGRTWTVPVPSLFTSPLSPMSVKRIKDRDLLAVYNPIPAYNGRVTSKGWGRTPLVCTVFKDNDLRPQKLFTIDDDEHCGYCYTAIHFTDDAVLLGYSVIGGYEGGGLGLRVKRVPLSELYT
ncbi:MAG: sialidase family protein [Clostridia bacterium]|jgi:sialidase-1|nr:exo-alpha-sialidase [Clostridiaceae bacterium]